MTSTPAVQRDHDHLFFSAMSLAMAVVVGVGFTRTYAVAIGEGTMTSLGHLHGALFALWMVLFIAQALLVTLGQTRWHRRVGVAGTFFAVVILVSGTVTAIVAARHGNRGNPPGPLTPVAFLLAATLRDMAVFGSLTGAAIALSHRVQTHKRLMLMATLGGLVPAGAGRFSNPVFGLIVLLVLLAAGPAYDWLSHRRVYGAYIWGIGVALGSWAIFYALAQTSVWQSFGQGLIE